MKHFFLLLISSVLLLLSGCTPKYDYVIHKPKVQYKKPSRKALSKLLKKNLGKKYVWAEEGPSSFDCSGLTYYCYGSMNVTIPRVSSRQAQAGMPIKREALQYGDLMFFDTQKKKTGKVTHVGIYIGHGKFQHASSSTEGVIVTDINSPYYKKRYLSSRRVMPGKIRKNSPVTMPVESYRLAKKPKTKIVPSKQSDTSKDIVPISPQLASNGSHYIQVGSFIDKPSSVFFDQITSKGYRYKVLKVSRNETLYNKILIGPYATKAAALQSLSSVRQSILPDAFVVKT